MSSSKIVRACAAYDDAEAAFARAGTADRSRELDVAREELLAEVECARAAAQKHALGNNNTRDDSFGCLAYFSAWLALRGGFRY